MTGLAADLVQEIRRRFPEGSCIVAGYSFGASMAIEAVRLMEARGIPVHRLYLIAPMPADFYRLGYITREHWSDPNLHERLFARSAGAPGILARLRR